MVEFRGHQVQPSVAGTTVVLDRPARQHRRQEGITKRVDVPGQPIRMRLVVSQLRSDAGEIVAEWLLTNLPERIPASRIALWYDWRWKIETFFKFLKSAGHHAEAWQQESAAALARRLLVASMAGVVVWQIARSQHPVARQVRQFLVRLSGRQMKRAKPYTEPALMAGLWVFLSLLEVLESYTVKDLKQFAEVVFPQKPYENTS